MVGNFLIDATAVELAALTAIRLHADNIDPWCYIDQLDCREQHLRKTSAKGRKKVSELGFLQRIFR